MSRANRKRVVLAIGAVLGAVSIIALAPIVLDLTRDYRRRLLFDFLRS